MRKTTLTEGYGLLVWQLVEARKAAGLTQVEVAESLNVPQQWVSSVETGKRRLDVIELWSYCRVIGVPFIEFLRALEQKLEREGVDSGDD